MKTGGRRAYDWRLGGAEEDLEPAAVLGTTPVRVRRVRSAALNGLFALACVYTLAIARDFLLPLAVGVMLYFLLRPPVRALKRARVPEPLGAALVLLALATSAALGLYALSWPAATWMARGPESLQRVESKLLPLVKRVQRLTRTATEMERITNVTESPTDAPKVEVREASLRGQVLGGLQSLVTGAMIVMTLVYFLLAEGDTFVSRVVYVLPRLKDRTHAAEIASAMERQISSYLFMTTLINATFGLLVGLLLWALGMPSPALWGFLAGVLKFIPYLGGLITTVILGLASILTFADLWWALLVPLAFFIVDTLHGNLVVPALLGRRLTLDTSVLFVGLLFWWYVWGTAGALLAVPMMAAFRIFCERVEGLRPVARFMGGQAIPPPPALEPPAETPAQ